MARRTFDVIDVAEILVHWHAGRSLSEMAGSLGVDRKTLRKYVAPAVAAGIAPGGPAKSEGEWHELVREWFPELADTRLRQVTWPAIAVHHDYIVEQLKARVRMSTIHQRLRDERGLAASVASFRRYVNAHVPEEARRSQVTVWNPHPAEAGEQAQIDYGMLGRWLDPVSGRLRTVWAFVMVLAYSRHMFVRPVLTMDQRAWTECNTAAFEFFGGVPAPAGAGQPEDRGGQAGSLRPEGEPVLCGDGRALRLPDRPREGAEAPRQGQGGTPDALCPRQLLAGPGVRVAAADAGRGGPLVAGGRRTAGVPAAGGRRPGGGVRGRGEGDAAAAAGRAVRAGHVGDGENRARHSCPGGEGPLLGALAAHRQDRRRPHHRQHGAVLHRRGAGEVPPAQAAGQADRLRRLPAGEDRLPHADPGLVPEAGRRHRPGLRVPDRRTAG